MITQEEKDFLDFIESFETTEEMLEFKNFNTLNKLREKIRARLPNSAYIEICNSFMNLINQPFCREIKEKAEGYFEQIKKGAI